MLLGVADLALAGGVLAAALLAWSVLQALLARGGPRMVTPPRSVERRAAPDRRSGAYYSGAERRVMGDRRRPPESKPVPPLAAAPASARHTARTRTPPRARRPAPR